MGWAIFGLLTPVVGLHWIAGAHVTGNLTCMDVPVNNTVSGEVISSMGRFNSCTSKEVNARLYMRSSSRTPLKDTSPLARQGLPPSVRMPSFSILIKAALGLSATFTPS